MTALSQAHLDWLQERKICPEIASKLGVHSGSKVGGRVFPDDRGNILVFPYFERGEQVGEKYRTLDKQFWQREGGRKTFYNSDVLDDPVVLAGKASVLVVEGEMDCLAAITAGHQFTVSVPDGAVPVPEGAQPEAVPEELPTDDAKFAFIRNNWDRLLKISRFVLATDADGPGRRMAALLVKHLGAARCSRLEFPDGCKDPNDITMRLDGGELIRRIGAAKEYPVKGVYELTDFNEEETKLFSVGIEGWASRLKLFLGAFVVVTGPTNMGKTAFSMQIAANMARDHGWRTAIFSPEQRPVELRHHLRKLYCGEWAVDATAKADEWIRKHFKLILGDPVAVGDRDEDVTLQWLLDRAEDAVLRYNIDMLIIDPWNELEHDRKHGESMTDYIGRAIRQIKRFARQYNVLVLICAHPTKDFMHAKDGKPRAVTLYDIENSAHWANKADIGIVVTRDWSTPSGAEINIAKLRYLKFGTLGKVPMQFHSKTQRFKSLEVVGDDHYRDLIP